MASPGPPPREKTWRSWLAGVRDASVGRASSAVVRTATSLAKRAYEYRKGTSVEKFIAEALSEYLDVNIDISSLGPIRGRFGGDQGPIRLKPMVRPLEAGADQNGQVAEVVYQEAGLIIDLERTRIAVMELSIDMEELFTGHRAASIDDTTCQLSFGDAPALAKVGITEFRLAAPGIRLVLKGFQMVIHHPAATYAGLPSIPPPPLKPKVLKPDKPDEFEPVEPEADGAEAEADDDEDPLAGLSGTPGFAANVLSEWILKDARVTLEGLAVEGNLSQEALPGSKFAADFGLEVSKLRLEIGKFYGHHKVLYQNLIKQRKYVDALKFHIMHLPLKLNCRSLKLDVGDAMEVNIDGTDQVSGLDLTVVHDDWRFFLLTGHIARYNIYLGKHKLVDADGKRPRPGANTSESDHWFLGSSVGRSIEFKLCNMLQRIEGNNAVLRKCYQENIGGEGFYQLRAYRARHAEIVEQLKEAEKALAQTDSESEPEAFFQKKQALEDLRDSWELSRVDQERFYEKLFFAQVELKVLPMTIDLSLPPICETMLKFTGYLMSWVAGLDEDGDGDISMAEWNTAVANEISAEEWMAATGVTEFTHDKTLDEMLAECRDMIYSLDDEALMIKYEVAERALSDVLDRTDRSNRHLAVIEDTMQLFVNLANTIEHLGDSEDGPLVENDHSELVSLLKTCSDMFRSECRAMLMDSGSSPPLGVQLKVRAALPNVHFRPVNTSDAFAFYGGRMSLDCPSPMTEDGSELSPYDAAHDKACLSLGATSLVVKIVGWNCLGKSIVLTPENILTLAIDLFSQTASGQVSTSAEPFSIMLSQGCLKAIYRLFAHASKELVNAESTGESIRMQGFTLNQLSSLYSGIMVSEIYRNWLVPEYKKPESVLQILAYVHFNIQIKFVEDSSQPLHSPKVTFVGLESNGHDELPSSPTAMLPKDEPGLEAIDSGLVDMISVKVNGLQVSLHGPHTYIRVHKVDAQLNIALIESIVLSIIAAINNPEENDEEDDLAQQEIPSTDGTSIIIKFPSPTAGTIKGSKQDLQVKLVEARGALDGIAVTAPSVMLILRYHEDVIVDGRAVQVRLDGLAAKSILEKHYDNLVEAKNAWFNMESVIDKLENKAYNKAEHEAVLMEAIKGIKESEIDKANHTLAHDDTFRLDRIAIFGGSIEVSGRLTKEQKGVPWLMAFTPGKEPLWQMHGSLSSPKPTFKVLDPLIGKNAKMDDLEDSESFRDQVGDKVADYALEVRNEIIDAAIDYHDITLSNTTLLAYVARHAISDFLDNIFGIIEHKPFNPCPDYLNFHFDALRLDLYNAWATLGLANHTNGSIGAKHFLWSYTACQTKQWLYSFLIWFVFTLDMIPALCGFLSFVSYSDTGWKTYDSMKGYSKNWQWIVVVLPKAFWLCLFFPVYMTVITNRAAASRVFFMIGALAMWVVMLMWTANFGEVMLPPFYWRTETGNGWAATHQMTIDSFMTFTLILSMICLIWGNMTPDLFEGFSRKLQTPFHHRQKIMYIAICYYIGMGIMEMTICLVEENWNKHLQYENWVWPPDGADCNKVIFFIYTTVKLLNGIYLLGIAVHEGCKGMPSPEQREKRGKALTVKVMCGVILSIIAEVIIVFFENGYGPDGVVLYNGVSLDQNFQPDSSIGIHPWTYNQVYDVNWKVVTSFCIYRQWHTMECVANMIWLFALFLFYLFWIYLAERERDARNQHRSRTEIQIMRLMTPKRQKRQELPIPPARAASDEEWIAWIKQAQVAIISMIDVLGEKEGGKLAANVARDGIYGTLGQVQEKSNNPKEPLTHTAYESDHEPEADNELNGIELEPVPKPKSSPSKPAWFKRTTADLLQATDEELAALEQEEVDHYKSDTATSQI